MRSLFISPAVDTRFWLKNLVFREEGGDGAQMKETVAESCAHALSDRVSDVLQSRMVRVP